MSIIEETLRQVLVAAATTAGSRIYPLVLPPEVTVPAIAYARVSSPRIRSLTGFSHYSTPRFQFTAWADNYAVSKALANEIRKALDGYSGWTAVAFPALFPIGWAEVQSISSLNELDMYEPQSKLYGVPADYRVAHRE